MRKRSASSTGFIACLVLTVLLAAAIWYFNHQAVSLRSTLQAEAAITPAPTLAPPRLFAKPTDALLRSGSIGPEVLQLQKRLQELGFYEGVLDGQFGGATKAALVLFQQQHGLEPDGMAGGLTLERLYGDAARHLSVTPVPSLPGRSGNLPMLINRSNHVPDHYAPPDLVRISEVAPADLLILKDPQVRAARPAVEALIKMVQGAQAQGLETWQVSEGYRSVQRQQELFEEQVLIYMRDDNLSEENARKASAKTVAPPGASEHHSGLAFDLTVPGYYFGDTKQALWLEENCWDYGFIMRYTANKEDITGYLPEPWHVRYVGVSHAKFMQEQNLALEEYLILYQ